MNKKEVLKERKLKVYQQSRGNNYNVPTIILKGVWLKEFGFNINNDVIVICNQNQIIIKKKKHLKTNRKFFLFI